MAGPGPGGRGALGAAGPLRPPGCFSPLLCQCRVVWRDRSLSLAFGCKVGRGGPWSGRWESWGHWDGVLGELGALGELESGYRDTGMVYWGS